MSDEEQTQPLDQSIVTPTWTVNVVKNDTDGYIAKQIQDSKGEIKDLTYTKDDNNVKTYSYTTSGGSQKQKSYKNKSKGGKSKSKSKRGLKKSRKQRK